MSGGACYCGVLCSSRACAVPAASTSSAASGRCSRLSPPRGLVEGLLLPELLTPSCSCRVTATLRPPFQRTLSTAWLGCVCQLLDDWMPSQLSRAFDVMSSHGKNFTLLFIEWLCVFLHLVHVAMRCVTLFLDVQLHVLQLVPCLLRMVWLNFFVYALLPHCAPDEHGSSAASRPRTPHHLHGNVPRLCSSLAHVSTLAWIAAVVFWQALLLGLH